MNMRERLARRLHERFVREGFSGAEPPAWERLPPQEQTFWISFADAVLDELREPDEGMIKAGEATFWRTEEDGTILRRTPQALEVWQAAIDKARDG